AIPGLAQAGVLLSTVLARLTYPYDLEWMEGGMLVHAYRFMHGETIYPPPSLDFIPYLYTPGYPAVLAGLSRAFGLSYALGRAISVVSLAGTLVLAGYAVAREGEERAGAICGAAIAGGFIAATYPWVDAWYDLVRGDTLFLAIGVAGIVVLRGAARSPRRVALAAALLATSFFFKQ